MDNSEAIRELVAEVERTANISEGEINESTRAQLLATSRKLTAALEDIQDQVSRFILLPTVHSCALVAWQFRLLGPWPKETMTAGELAAHLKVDQVLVVRIVRALQHFGIFSEVGEENYRHNVLSTRLSTPPTSISSFHMADKIRQISSLPEYFAEYGYENPGNNPNHPSVFQWLHKSDKEFFQWMISQPDKNDLHEFNQAMSLSFDIKHGHKGTHVFDLYPFEMELKDASAEEVVVVDVGGGYGHLLREVRKRLPEIMGKLVLEDLPETVGEAGGVAPTENVEIQPYNFFTQEQPVKGARMYVFRHVLADWSDHECRRILRNTIPALVKGVSRILLIELVLPPTNPPLWGSLMDINMMKYSGMVRKESQWRALVESVGLTLEKVWYGGKGDSIIEVVLS